MLQHLCLISSKNLQKNRKSLLLPAGMTVSEMQEKSTKESKEAYGCHILLHACVHAENLRKNRKTIAWSVALLAVSTILLKACGSKMTT